MESVDVDPVAGEPIGWAVVPIDVDESWGVVDIDDDVVVVSRGIVVGKTRVQVKQPDQSVS